MKYFVRAKLKEGKSQQLKRAIIDGSLGKGSIAGREYIRNMKSARLLEDGTVVWIEVCFCNPPLAEERPYWKNYFNLLEILDAVDRQTCNTKTQAGSLMYCKYCNCNIKKEMEIEHLGEPFYQSLN